MSVFLNYYEDFSDVYTTLFLSRDNDIIVTNTIRLKLI